MRVLTFLAALSTAAGPEGAWMEGNRSLLVLTIAQTLFLKVCKGGSGSQVNRLQGSGLSAKE
jgi:hypothetical protein